jgi:phage FluMu protein Com
MADDKKTGNELRCGCGSLIGRVVKEGVEIKCRKCKKISILSLTSTREVIIRF